MTLTKEDLLAAIAALEERDSQPYYIVYDPWTYTSLWQLAALRVELGKRVFESLEQDFITQGAVAFMEYSLWREK